MRVKKLSVLIKTIPQYVDSRGDPDNPTEPAFKLKFTEPRGGQYAIIDMYTGKVRRFVRETGNIVQEVADPENYLNVIDRRIQYLADKHNKKVI